jgi:hypothetical protein
MPKGIQDAVKRAREEIEAKMAAGGPRFMYFRLKPDESAVIRFLEEGDDIAWAYCHELPPRGNREYPEQVVCLDSEDDGTACPMCEHGMKRSFKGWVNIIWRDAPVFKRDADNKIERNRKNEPMVVGHDDQVAVWTSGINVFEEIAGKTASYKGLLNRDWVITRIGEGLKTKYRIEPLLDDNGDPIKKPMSDKDKELAEGKADTGKVSEPLSYDDVTKKMRGQQPTGGGKDDDDDADDSTAGNIFVNKVKQRQGASK